MAVTTTKSSKRKSTETTEQSLKKLKVAKSADRPQPLKSALKKADEIVESPTQPKTASAASKKAKAAASVVAPEPAVQEADEVLFDDEEEEAQGAELTPDQTAALLAGFSDSEDEEEENDAISVDKLPKAPVSDALTTTSGEDDSENTPGVVYVGRIPHGFYEKQMRAYFSQFGEITHLRLARSRRSARSQHYGFLEFSSAAVADIVAKTMDKYLLFNHILQVKRVPNEQVKETIWRGEGRKRRAMPMNRIEGTRLRKGTTKEGWDKRIDRENKKRQSKAEKLKEMGYEFDSPTIKRLGDVADNATMSASNGAEQQLLKETAEDAEAVVTDGALPAKSKKRAASSTADSKKTKKSRAKA